jgi:release factor glutamine methyltransferase
MNPTLSQPMLPLRWRLARSIYRAAQRVWLRWWLPRTHRVQIEYVNGWPLIVLPGVFNGVRVRTGLILARAFERMSTRAAMRVLDLGTGTGLGAIFAAQHGARVVATDINPEAVRCARLNASVNHLEDRIDVRLGDLFEAVRGEKFDLILFNPPFYRGQSHDFSDRAWRGLDVFDRFLRELTDYLTGQGRALVVLSTDGDIEPALMAATHLLKRIVMRRDLINEIVTVYEVQAA